MIFAPPSHDELNNMPLHKLFHEWLHSQQRLKFWRNPGRAIFPNRDRYITYYEHAEVLFYKEIELRASAALNTLSLLVLIESGNTFILNKPNLQ